MSPMDKAATTVAPSTTDQTHDFMNVDSFSQLPFIRPAPTPTKDKSALGPSSSGIRLFGIEFSSSSTATEKSDSGESSQSNNQTNEETKEGNNNNNNGENGESGRKFECHYCCRNFPTSQALGGHQNAHKRERQHAKRAHLQSAMMAADPHNHHIYNLVNYSHNHHRSTNSYYPHTSSLTNTSRYSYHPTSASTLLHSSTPASFTHLNNNNNNQPPTINGSPLMWRIPTTVHSHHGLHRDRSLHSSLPIFASSSSLVGRDNSAASRSSMSMNMNLGGSSQGQVGRRSNGEHVSLDLHL